MRTFWQARGPGGVGTRVLNGVGHCAGWVNTSPFSSPPGGGGPATQVTSSPQVRKQGQDQLSLLWLAGVLWGPCVILGVIHFVKFHFIHSFHIFGIEDSYTRYQNKKVQGTISFPPSPPPASWLLCRQCSWDLVSSKTVSSIPKWSRACSIFFLFKMRILPFAFFHLKCYIIYLLVYTPFIPLSIIFNLPKSYILWLQL